MVALLQGGPHRDAQPDPAPLRPSPLVHEVLRSPGRPLGSGPRAEMEARLGADFADVRVHEGPAAVRSASALGASAYTSGEHIVMGRDGSGSAATLAHELTHVIQQRSGQVAGGDTGDGFRLSTPDDRFERAAEANARRAIRGPVPSSEGSGRPGRRSTVNHRPRVEAVQVQRKKSRFTSIEPQQKNVETPLATLHTHLEDYFEDAGVPEAYAFGTTLTNIDPDDRRYSGTFDRAGKAVAKINPRTPNRSSKNRDNDVILPYGHFGVMERAIFGRGDKGNIYDGGHLVEHILLSGQDADIHGNIAPQENKYFNQQLFRTNERIAEEMMGASGVGKFDYTTQVTYPETEYDRTFTQLELANVVPATLRATLARIDPQQAQTLANLTLTFQRWVPRVWENEIDVGAGKTIPAQISDSGVSHTHIKGSLADVDKTVVDLTNIAIHTSRKPAPVLERTFSGTLAGYISTMGVTPQGKVIVGGQQIVNSRFLQPEPMDVRDQPPAVYVAGGTVRPVLPPAAVVSNRLKAPFKLSRLTRELRKIDFTQVTRKRLDDVAKETSAHYKTLRDREIITNADTGNKFLFSWIQAGGQEGKAVNRRAFHAIVKGARLAKAASKALFLLLLDPNFLN